MELLSCLVPEWANSNGEDVLFKTRFAKLKQTHTVFLQLFWVSIVTFEPTGKFCSKLHLKHVQCRNDYLHSIYRTCTFRQEFTQ